MLDTSVLLAGVGSAKGPPDFVRMAAAHGWELVGSEYCAEWARRNLPKVGPVAMRAWRRIINASSSCSRRPYVVGWFSQLRASMPPEETPALRGAGRLPVQEA